MWNNFNLVPVLNLMPKTFNLVLEKFNFSAKEELKLMLQKLEISDEKNKIHTEKIKDSAKKK